MCGPGWTLQPLPFYSLPPACATTTCRNVLFYNCRFSPWMPQRQQPHTYTNHTKRFIFHCQKSVLIYHTHVVLILARGLFHVIQEVISMQTTHTSEASCHFGLLKMKATRKSAFQARQKQTSSWSDLYLHLHSLHRLLGHACAPAETDDSGGCIIPCRSPGKKEPLRTNSPGLAEFKFRDARDSVSSDKSNIHSQWVVGRAWGLRKNNAGYTFKPRSPPGTYLSSARQQGPLHCCQEINKVEQDCMQHLHES